MPAKKGTKSKTRKGDLDYTTKKGDAYFHEDHHLVKKSYKPFNAHKGSVSKTHLGLDYVKMPIAGGGVLKISICHGDSDSDMEGEGLWDSVRGLAKTASDTAKSTMNTISNTANNTFHKIENTANNTINTIKDVAHKVWTGDTGMPPNVQNILNQYGNQLITKIDIVRNPVGDALVGALSIVSRGNFGNNLKNAPYDKLYHLKIVITLQDGTRVSMEKVERVNLVVNPQPVKDEQGIPTTLNGKQLTLGQLYDNAKNYMGGKFYPYSARDNNCQNFILSVLQASGIGNQQDYEFVKQDTKQLFGDDSFLRKASNTVTDIGARFNVLQQGGDIDDEYLHSAVALMKKQRKSKKGLVATTTVPTLRGGNIAKGTPQSGHPDRVWDGHSFTDKAFYDSKLGLCVWDPYKGTYVYKDNAQQGIQGGKLTFKDFAHGWARHHRITHGGALKSKHAKAVYKTINDHLLKRGEGWDDFVNGAKKFFTGGYNDQINQGIQGVVNKVKDGFDAFGNKITGTAEEITNTVRSQADKVISDIKNGVQTDINAVKNLMNNAELTFNEKMELMKGYAKLVNPALKEFGNKIKSGVMVGVDAIKKYGKEAINWVKDHEDDMKKIAISVAKFAVKKGIPLVGEELGKVFADMLALGAFSPYLVPIAQTLGGMLGKKLGNMLADYIMSLGLADMEGNPDADKWLAITGQAIDAGKMAYSGYQGLKAVNNYLSGASEASKAVGAVASAGSGLKRRSTAQMKKLLKEKLDNYHIVNTLKRGRGRPRKGGNIVHYRSGRYDSETGEELP